ncbi:MAG TPA: putative quinol monooxygenase [Pseudoxanthomonas sp.]|nr:putative quinol monooxygenase [Pseudoxanthomonas sp.]
MSAVEASARLVSDPTLDLFATLHARPGRADEVRRALETVRAPTRREPGCIAFDCFASIRDADEFCIHSRWRDLAAFERHAALPHTVAFLAQMHDLLDPALKIALAQRM